MSSLERLSLTVTAVLCTAAALTVWASGGSVTASVAVVALGLLALAPVLWREGRSEDPAVREALEEFDDRLAAAADERHQMRMRAETAGRFREEFVASVRHELNTPLNAILGFTDVLLQEVDGPLNEPQREDVQAVRSAGVYLQELVEAVLSEWVPDRESSESLAPVSVEGLLTSVARLLRGQVGDKPVALEVEVSPDTPSPLADERRLRQVLINLGTNALRATARGSVRLEARPHEDGICISVRDTGVGMSPEDLGQLFEEYAQVGSEDRRRGGSGLGLALSRDMVEWHGGRIEVESTLGEGSVFRVVLPTEAD